jgi:hypothetical protein
VRGRPSATPVFVDPTGRRAKAVRVLGSAAAVTALGFLFAVAVVLTAAPQPPHFSKGAAHSPERSVHALPPIAGRHR